MKTKINFNKSDASWSAVAERSGDTAFGRMENLRARNDFCALESGVALRFPPQSKTPWVGGIFS
jgi:hypothetical protein